MPPTAQSLWALWKRLRAGHVRILWLVLGALLMVSVLPLGLYHRLVLQLSQDKLVDTERDRKSTRLNSSHGYISYAVFCLKKKKYVTKQKVADVALRTHLHFDRGQRLP